VKAQSKVGRKFGMLTVTRHLGIPGEKKERVTALCECGNQWEGYYSNLSNKTTTSCGCKRRNNRQSVTHGRSNTPEYNIRYAMIARCTNPNNNEYHRYGAVGVEVCERWLESFENFFADMGQRPSSSHSIERIDSTKGYSPENCRWADAKAQANNRSSNIVVEFEGERVTLMQLSERTEINYGTLIGRYKRGDRGEKLTRAVAGR